MLNKDQLPNHIEEYINSNKNQSEHIELFEGSKDDIDLKTDLSIQEIILVSKLALMDSFLNSRKIPSAYGCFLEKYNRLKVSLDRKSRSEFVNVNKRERFDDNMEKFNAFTNLKKVKE